MNLYPAELREPPVPVVAFIGGTKLHQTIFKQLSVVTLPDGTKRPQFYPIGMERSDSLPSSTSSSPAATARRSTRTTNGGAAGSASGLSTTPTKSERSMFGGHDGGDAGSGMPPQGILKANWMWKHTRVVPSVAVFLFPEWAKDHKWRAKETEFYSMLDSMRGDLRSRNIRTLVVLVQKSPPPDSGLEERLSNFRKRAEVDSKRIIYFYESDVSGSVGRLEKVMMEQALSFYKDTAQRLKKEKEKLNKNLMGHKDYYVRYCFKVGFYTEFIKDTRISIKHYLDGYTNLINLTVERQRVAEIKIVAEYLHFKLCKLHFNNGNIGDAVAQLERHIKTFRRAVGMAEKEFEHWAWLSRQYEVFAQLLEQHPQMIDVENKKYFPGYYYHTAAIYAHKRKLIAKRLCEPVRDSPILERYKDVDQKPLVSIDRSKQTYVGQPPPPFQDHPLEQAGEPMVPDEMEDLYIAVAAELKVNHTDIIILLLLKARSYYDRIKLTRMVLQIDALLAQQYVDAGRFQDAEPLFESLVLSYKQDGWRSLLNNVLESALICEQQLHDTRAFFNYALQLLSSEMPGALRRKQQIQQNIISAITSPSDILPALVRPLRVPGGGSLLTCSVAFEMAEVLVGSLVNVNVHITSRFPSTIRFDTLNLEFSDSSCNLTKANDQDDLTMEPGVERKYTFPLSAKTTQQLRCTSVQLELGTNPNCIIFILDPQPVKIEENIAEEGMVEVVQNGRKMGSGWATVEFKEHPAEVELQVIHEPPALANEFYKLELRLHNKEKDAASGSIQFSFHVPTLAAREEAQFYLSKNDTSAISEIEFTDLMPGASTSHVVYVHFPTAGQKNPIITVSYETASRHKTVFSTQLSIIIQRPFNLNFEFYTRDMKQIIPTFLPAPSMQPHPTPMPVISEPSTPTPGSAGPLSQSLDLSALGASRDLSSSIAGLQTASASLSSSTPLSSSPGGSLPIPPSLSLASSAELTSTILVEEMSADEDGTSAITPMIPLTVDEPCWLVVEMTATPPYPLSIDHTDLTINTKDSAPIATCTSTSFDAIVMDSGQRYSLWYSLTPLVAGENIVLGTFSLRWKRTPKATDHAADDDTSVLIQEKIPPARIIRSPLKATLNVPPEGEVGALLPCVVEIKNLSSLPQFVTFAVKEQQALNEHPYFLHSGEMETGFMIQPHCSQVMQHLLLPIRSGFLPLPRFVIQSKRYEVDVATSQAQRRVFVKPSTSVGSIPLSVPPLPSTPALLYL